jgi:hypothetical protein
MGVDLRFHDTGAPNQLPFTTLNVTSASLASLPKRNAVDAESVHSTGAVIVDKKTNASNYAHEFGIGTQKLAVGEALVSFAEAALLPSLGAFGIRLHKGWQKSLKDDALEGHCDVPLVDAAAAASIPSPSVSTTGKPHCNLQASVYMHCFSYLMH